MTKAELAALPLPSFLKPETWAAFVAMRKAKGQRAPLTTHAAILIINALTRFKAEGYDPNACLEQSIINGWSGVFVTKDKPPPAPVNGTPKVLLLNNFLCDIAQHEAKLAEPEAAERARQARLAAMAKHRPARTS
jgi:hypothetical protein